MDLSACILHHTDLEVYDMRDPRGVSVGTRWHVHVRRVCVCVFRVCVYCCLLSCRVCCAHLQAREHAHTLLYGLLLPGFSHLIEIDEPFTHEMLAFMFQVVYSID